jgi:hypothetical protein
MNGRQASMHLAASHIAGLAVCGRLKVLALVGPFNTSIGFGSQWRLGGICSTQGELDMRCAEAMRNAA